jgi:putative ABC transport system substrate-binding protein
MRRREFVVAIGATAVSAQTAHAQQPMAVVGLLTSASPETRRDHIASFVHGLADTGWTEGQNVTIEYRWAKDNNDRLPELAADLVRRHVAVIAVFTTAAISVAKTATTTIPIVFLTNGDPVKLGFVSSLNRPGGNITGVTLLNVEAAAKRLQLLHELVPAAETIALLVNPTNRNQTEPETREVEQAARALGLRVDVLDASSETEIDAAFATIVQHGVKALFVAGDSFFNSRREQLAVLARYNGIPAVYTFREHVVAGGLMSYGGVLVDGYRQAGVYAGKVLSGARPSDLPILQSTKLELVINLKTAKALGLDISPNLLAQADEVIE